MPSSTARPSRSQDLVDAALLGETDAVRAVIARRPRVPVDGRACPTVTRAKVQYSIRASALYFAAATRRPGMVDLLLAHGATVDVRATDGSTPLHIACVNRSGDPERVDAERAVVQRLLAAGADANARWSTEKPDDLPWSTRDTPLMVMLRTPGSNRRTALLLDLLAAGADPQVIGTEGRTLIHHAVSARWADAIPVLAEAGVDWKRPDGRGHTPFDQVLALPQAEQAPLIAALMGLEQAVLYDALHGVPTPPVPVMGRPRPRL